MTTMIRMTMAGDTTKAKVTKALTTMMITKVERWAKVSRVDTARVMATTIMMISTTMVTREASKARVHQWDRRVALKALAAPARDSKVTMVASRVAGKASMTTTERQSSRSLSEVLSGSSFIAGMA